MGKSLRSVSQGHQALLFTENHCTAPLGDGTDDGERLFGPPRGTDEGVRGDDTLGTEWGPPAAPPV